MTTASRLPSPFPNPSRSPRVALPAKLVVIALLAIAVLLVVFLRDYRTAEVVAAGGVVGLFSSSGTIVDTAHQNVYFGLGGSDPFGLHMAPECTSALLVLPLVLVAAILVFLRPHLTRRVLMSLVIGAVVLFAVNQLRLLLIVTLVHFFGPPTGYYWGHTLLGSVVSIFGGAVALVLFVWLTIRGTSGERAPRDRDTHTGKHERGSR